jgi:hypothetical protein
MVYTPQTFSSAIADRKTWGHIFESGIGAHIMSQAFTHRFEVFYWRDRNDEVDFILRKHNSVVAIEVKSNAEANTSGLDRFKREFNPSAAIIVGSHGISPADFLSLNLSAIF